MALVKTVNVSGTVELPLEEIIIQLDFVVPQDNKPVNYISFNFNKDNVYVSGVLEDGFTYYNVSDGIVTDEVMLAIEDKLEDIKIEYSEVTE